MGSLSWCRALSAHGEAGPARGCHRLGRPGWSANPARKARTLRCEKSARISAGRADEIAVALPWPRPAGVSGAKPEGMRVALRAVAGVGARGGIAGRRRGRCAGDGSGVVQHATCDLPEGRSGAGEGPRPGANGETEREAAGLQPGRLSCLALPVSNPQARDQKRGNRANDSTPRPPRSRAGWTSGPALPLPSASRFRPGWRAPLGARQEG